LGVRVPPGALVRDSDHEGPDQQQCGLGPEWFVSDSEAERVVGPHCVRISGCGFVEPVRYSVEVTVEEPRVDVERDSGGGVTEHALDNLDVRAGGDRKAGGGVTQVVRRQRLQAAALDRRVEDVVAEVGVRQLLASLGREQQIIRGAIGNQGPGAPERGTAAQGPSVPGGSSGCPSEAGRRSRRRWR
jgi:hypothetical protein